MWAKGPQAGGTPKQDALQLLPQGCKCRRISAMGITGYVVTLSDGRQIGSGGNAQVAWGNAQRWAERNLK